MTATQETSEWVVYRIGVRKPMLNAVPKRRWEGWSEGAKSSANTELLAEGLTREQAQQFCKLARDEET